MELSIFSNSCELEPKDTGIFTVNELPSPTSLLTIIWPFIALTKPLTIANPIPKPGTPFSFPLSLSKGLNIDLILSFGIPCPVSSTFITRFVLESNPAITFTLPFCVYLIALVTRFSTICIILDESPIILMS